MASWLYLLVALSCPVPTLTILQHEDNVNQTSPLPQIHHQHQYWNSSDTHVSPLVDKVEYGPGKKSMTGIHYPQVTETYSTKQSYLTEKSIPQSFTDSEESNAESQSERIATSSNRYDLEVSWSNGKKGSLTAATPQMSSKGEPTARTPQMSSKGEPSAGTPQMSSGQGRSERSPQEMDEDGVAASTVNAGVKMVTTEMASPVTKYAKEETPATQPRSLWERLQDPPTATPTEEDLVGCLMGNNLTYVIGNFTLKFSQSQYSPYRANSTTAECTIDLFQIFEASAQLHFLRKTCDPAHPLYVETPGDPELSWEWTGCEHLSVNGPWVPIVTHEEKHYRLRFRVPKTGDVTVWFNFTFVSLKTFQPHKFLIARNLGFLQSPEWNPAARAYYRITEPYTYSLNSPKRHVIMFSFPHLHLVAGEKLSFQLRQVEGRQSKTIEPYNIPEPFIMGTVRPGQRSRVFLMKVSSRSYAIGLGYRLLFTFHKKPRLPRKLRANLWNCSVPYWPDFVPHLDCNLMTQCAEAEDEMNCGYETCRSKQGFVMEDSCFVIQYFNSSEERRGQFPTYYDAKDFCSRNGGALASFSTEKLWKRVTELMARHLLSPNVHVGLITRRRTEMYTFIPVWENGIAAYHVSVFRMFNRPVCGFYNGFVDYIELTPCHAEIRHLHTMCQYRLQTETSPAPKKESRKPVQLSLSTSSSFKLDTVSCPAGHYTRAFLACDVQAVCFSSQDWGYTSPKESWDMPSRSTCPAQHLTSLPPSFLCAGVGQRVPYSMVCDHRLDCQDSSDESFCHFLPCPLTMLPCGNLKQCYALKENCDGVYDCLNGADEMQCLDTQLDPSMGVTLPFKQPPSPFMVSLDGKGGYVVEPLSDQPCPDTHFWCLSDNFCLPVYVRCNGISDCPEREDERGCTLEDLCPGYYRCRSSSVCLHPTQVCDGVAQCPQRDDESWCNVTCPRQCQCWGLAFVCRQKFSGEAFSELRYVDARDSGMTLREFAHYLLLIHLSLAHCDLTQIDRVAFNNLNSLDLSDNRLQGFNISQFKYFATLKTLILSGNPFSLMFQNDHASIASISLQYLDLSFVEIPVLDTTNLIQFHQLRVLNLSGCQINQMGTSGFSSFKDLSVLDVKGCELSKFPQTIFKGLSRLQTVHADNFKLCCEATLPEGFNLIDCHAPFDEVSSCDALLRSDTYRVLLSVSAVMALIGNLATFTYRLFQKSKKSSGFHVFVTNLCIADFLMGVYLSIIGVADRMYLGTYLWNDTRWRHSAACTIAGFVSLVSSEASVFMICLITIDRFLVLRFPFRQLRFSCKAAHLMCVTTWTTILLLASWPLFPNSPFGEFYNHVGTCIPLPITRKEFQGDDFAFGIMIILNFALFMLIAIGQGLIYLSVRANKLSADNGRQSQDLAIARRLITVAVSDFLCWFPIGLLGMLAAQGLPISGEVNVAMAILVLPVNSVINPFLYTLNMVMERRRKAKEESLLKWLETS